MDLLSTTCSEGSKQAPGFGVALEALALLAAVAAASLCFIAGWLTMDGAAVLTLTLLLSLIVFAWKRFDGGRHPCFLFLCLLALFQGGRLIAYFAGQTTDIARIELMTAYPFDVSPEVTATMLLSLALSGMLIYLPCRCYYRPMGAQSGSRSDLLPYLYSVLCLSMPVQLFKSYCYYQYAAQHGGYLVFFIDHAGLAGCVPTAVRAISLVTLPALVGIFVLERRPRLLYAAAAAYLVTVGPVVLTGSRGAVFTFLLSLWYLAKVKSGKRVRLSSLALMAMAFLLMGGLIGAWRVKTSDSVLSSPIQLLAEQGMSLNVTQVAIAERRQFAPHFVSYLGSEVQAAFVAADQANYVAGKRFNEDVAMFLNPIAFQLGFGSGSAYLAEAYVLGRLWGVVVISILLGLLLHATYIGSRSAFGLFLVTMILPDVLWMTRGGLLDWLSAGLRVVVSILVLVTGWVLYRAAAFLLAMLLGRPSSRLSRSQEALLQGQ